jgi:hypothetical protein
VPGVFVPQVTVPRAVQPQIGTVRPNDRAYRPDYRPNYRPDYRPNYRPNYYPSYRPYYGGGYYRPYYNFLPRVRLGFGLWIGYPVRYPTYFYPYTTYPYGYSYPYPNTVPYPTYPAGSYPTGSYPPGSYPGTSAVGAAGGLSFEITPAEAGIFVDGIYIGMVGQFTPDQPPLPLSPGRHHVEIQQPGFEIIEFDVDVLPGQVIPYRGELRRF